MDNPISLGVEDPPTVHCTIPGQDEEDLESMTTEEILSALSLLRIFSTQHDKNQKEMKSNLADHSSAIEEQKSSTELLSTQVAELRSELGAVRNQLAQQSIKVNRAERLSNRAHSSKLYDSLRADQLVLLINDVSPIITSQTEAPALHSQPDPGQRIPQIRYLCHPQTPECLHHHPTSTQAPSHLLSCQAHLSHHPRHTSCQRSHYPIPHAPQMDNCQITRALIRRLQRCQESPQ